VKDLFQGFYWSHVKGAAINIYKFLKTPSSGNKLTSMLYW